ncbi:MAG: hypothetical protein Q4A66_10175, partial [Eubacteriales bacterium]|nr:hypothetical protein [Eubacteriales bacterium]
MVQDSAGRFIEARARHISYDLGGACIGLYKFKNTPANAVCARLMELADHDAGVNMQNVQSEVFVHNLTVAAA